MSGYVLVTGSQGFVGRALAKRLGERMLACDLLIGQPIEKVIRSTEFQSVHTVVHCAAIQLFTPGYDLRAWRDFHEMNVKSTQLLANACESAGIRKFIHVSTEMVYGKPLFSPISEEHPLRPLGFYGYSKLLSERAVLNASGIPVITIFRPCVIGGPGRAGIFKTIIRLFQLGLPIPLFGDGNNPFQLVHVEDFADLIMEAIECDVPGIFNAGSQNVTTMREKIWTTATLFKRNARFVPLPELLGVSTCWAIYKLRLGTIHPEQFLVAGRPFVLSLDKVFKSFRWRPKYSDNEVVLDSMGSLVKQ